MTEKITPVVTANAAESRFEAHVDGKLAGFVDYRRFEDSIEFTHTEVDPAFEGHGIGSALIGDTLRAVQAEGGLTVVPTCSFVARYIERHPEFTELTSGR